MTKFGSLFEAGNDRSKIAKDTIQILSKFLATKYPGWKLEICTKAGDKEGICEYGRKTIGLTRYVLSDCSVGGVVSTFIHELAHIETPGNSHDKVWQNKNTELLNKYSNDVTKLVKDARRPYITYFATWGADKELRV